jgi:hypothetical protein
VVAAAVEVEGVEVDEAVRRGGAAEEERAVVEEAEAAAME